MQPKGGESSPMNFELPPQASSPEAGDQRQEKGQEAPAAPAEQAGKRPAAPVLPSIPADLPAAEPPAIAAPPQDDSDAFDPHQHAEETDHIEPEWVDKAKAVISQTRDDPYMQKHEMSKIKADYIQKRFNKQVKTDEAAG